MKKLLIYGVAFFMTVAICFTMLIFATYAPQNRIDQNIIDSVIYLQGEGDYPLTLDRADTSLLDNWTDALILMASKAMREDSKSTVLTNPVYGNWNDGPVSMLFEYAWAIKPQPTSYYTRYWMGFRAVVRWLLSFLDYYQIRRYLTIGLFSLLFCVTQKVSKHLGRYQAAAFFFSVLFVRPYVICYSLQFSCCFLIAFVAMLAVPWIHRHPKYQSLFFMEVGMLTMYFDFYTAPIITFGMPMIFLSLLQLKEDRGIRLRTIVKDVLIWATGYIGMWLSKLLLTELLTDQPAFATAFASVSYRLGIGSNGSDPDSERGAILAIKTVWEKILYDKEGVVLFWILVTVLAGLVLYKAWKKELNLDAARRGVGLLVLAAFPYIWFSIASEPTIAHAYFQYRTIVLLFWGISSYLCLIMEKREV